MTTLNTTPNSAPYFERVQGCVYFYAHIPTQAPEGILASVTVNYREGDGDAVLVGLRDSSGQWARRFETIEEWAEWLDYISTGPITRISVGAWRDARTERAAA